VEGAIMGAIITFVALIFILVGLANFTQNGWIMALVGCLFAFFGGSMVLQYFNYRETCTFDKTQKIILFSKGVNQSGSTQYRLHNLEEVQLGKEEDSEGDPVYHIQLLLKSQPDRPIKVTFYGSYNQQEVENQIQRIRSFLR
jgi:hypothetical protein